MHAIQVANIAKSFQINRSSPQARTLVDEISRGASSLTRWVTRQGPLSDLETFWALQDVSFDISHGEAVGLIGRNGSGKSTLLKILSRITAPTRGTVRLVGRVASLLEVGTGFHPELSARQNIFLNGAILGMRRKEIIRHMDQIVDFAGIEAFLDEPVKHFSSGMYMRLAFSVAAFLESEILLVDEVLAVGDASFQEKCLGTMRDAAKGGRTVIFVSHNMTAVSQLTNHTIALNKGRIVFNGPTASAIIFYLKHERSGVFQGRYLTEQIECQNHYRHGDRLFIQEMGLARDQGSEIKPDGQLRMEFVIQAKTSYEGVRITYTINSVTGQPLITGHSPKFAVNHGQQLVELCISDIRLIPGEYQFSIYLGTGGWHEARAEYDMYIGFGRLTVSTTTAGGRAFGDWDGMWALAYHSSSELSRFEHWPT